MFFERNTVSRDNFPYFGKIGVLNQVKQIASGKPPLILDVVKTEKEYDEKRLEASTWVSTTISGVYHELARIEGFKMLLAYIQGHNEDRIQLKMTPPILTRVTSSGNENFESTFTVSLCVQTEKGKRLPKPSNPLIYIEHFPGMEVFVKRVDGIVSEETWLWEARRLAEILRHKEHIRTDVYFTAAYENPMQLMCRNNEVWLVKYENEGAIVPLKRDNTINVGDQSLPVHPIVVKLIGFIIGYFTFLIAFFNTLFNIIPFVKKHIDLICAAVRNTLYSLVTRNSLLNFVARTSFGYYNRCLDVVLWLSKCYRYK